MKIIYGRDVIIRIRFMGLIISASTLLWADVKYRKHWKSRQGGDIAVFFADYIRALPTFNIGGECFFVADGVQAFRGEALAQVVDFVVVLLKKKGGFFV